MKYSSLKTSLQLSRNSLFENVRFSNHFLDGFYNLLKNLLSLSKVKLIWQYLEPLTITTIMNMFESKTEIVLNGLTYVLIAAVVIMLILQ